MVSRASTVTGGGVDLTWENNLVLVDGPGRALIEDLGSGTCSEQGCTCQGLCSRPAWCPATWPAPQSNNDLMQNELSLLRSEGDQGRWFGSESGDTDVWGQRPAMVGAATPSATNLHLTSADTAARGRGQSIAGFGNDFDGQTRFGTWDLGADQFVSACTTASQCNDGLSCTNDQCVGGNCVTTDTCGSGTFCSHATGGCESSSPPTTLPPDPDPDPNPNPDPNPDPGSVAPPRLLSVDPLP